MYFLGSLSLQTEFIWVTKETNNEREKKKKTEIDISVSLSFTNLLDIITLSIKGINNVNRIEWIPIRSVIIRVINKIGRTSMTTGRIGRHQVL